MKIKEKAQKFWENNGEEIKAILMIFGIASSGIFLGSQLAKLGFIIRMQSLMIEEPELKDLMEKAVIKIKENAK